MLRADKNKRSIKLDHMLLPTRLLLLRLLTQLVVLLPPHFFHISDRPVISYQNKLQRKIAH